MRFSLRAIVILATSLSLAEPLVPVQAQSRKFEPYEALVDVDGEYVRSGPGQQFYPTDKLRKGEKVVVHRHDMGGWCMIAPPAGSFSWIRADHVQKSGTDRGVLRANQVVVHVGSSLNPDEFTTIQGNLSKGDAVEIIGEKVFSFDDGQKLMYKISPIKREWRWISRKSIVAVDSIQRDPIPADSPTPRPKKPSPVAEKIELDPDAFAKPVSTGPKPTEEDPVPSKKPATDSQDVAPNHRARLSQIDQRFREMVQQEPDSWTLHELEEDYETLDREAKSQSLRDSIQARLAAVERYSKIHLDYVEFMKLTEETKRRDAELATKQGKSSVSAGTNPEATASITPFPITATPSSPKPGAPSPTPLPGQPATNGQIPGATSGPTAVPPNQPPTPPAFAGAGIVQPMAKTFPGGPQYVLVAPNGRMLAFLQPAQGVDLKRHAGHSMGIIGERSFRQDWQSDTIVVRGLQPVQLRAAR